MLLYYIPVAITLFANNEKPLHCHDQKGTSVFKMHIHIDELAIPEFGAQGKSKNPLRNIMEWFGAIFDDINRELQPYGVQFHCDFSELPTTEFPMTYDKSKCPEGNPPGTRAVIADTAFLETFKRRYGNRLVVFFCPNNNASALKGHVKKGSCNNTLGFLFGPLHILEKTIKNNVIKSVFGKSRDDTNFNSTVCKVANKCVSKNDSVFGQYVGDLKAVRHISKEKYIIPDGERLGEHDLYDDIFVEKYDNNLV